MSLTLKQMRYAVSVAELAHFGRAAERSNISQSALSQQILQLEEALGTTLFDRSGRAVRVTPFGREFVERARAILEQADDLLSLAAGRAGLPAQPLRFGLIPTVAPYLLPDIFPALRRAFPTLAFTVSENRTDDLLVGLADGTLDLALIASEPRPGGPRLVAEPLFTDAFVLAASKTDDVADPVNLSALDLDRMLLLNEGHCFRDQAIAACGLKGDASTRTFAATSLSTIVEFVANGQGITLLPEISLKKEASPRIRVHPLAEPASRQLSLIWRETTPFTALFHQIAETIREARSHPPSPSRGG